MKTYISLFISFFLPVYLFSQVITNIGEQKTVIYPLSINKTDLSQQLLPLKSLFSSKSIIGMGEATHGSREFFEIKNGVFQWLVNECNYSVFGIEATYGGCSYINDFIQSGEGDIESVMIYLDFWTWQTEEVRELILWMKDYNAQAEHSEKLSFYGFDMQNLYTPVQYLNDYTKRYLKVQYDTIKAISFPVLSKSDMEIWQLLQNKKINFKDTLQETHQKLTDWMLLNKSHIEITQSDKQYQTLELCLENFGQAIKSLSVHNASKFRDSCMANNVLKIQKLENKKMFIWAHNGHINLAYPDDKSLMMGLRMGKYLKKNMGDAYYSIGFVFNQGSFQAIQGPKSIGGAIFKYLFAKKKLYQGLKVCSVPVYKKNTFTNALSEASYPTYFVDVSKSENPIFSTLLKTYDIGAIFMNHKRCSTFFNAKKQFDGLIYVDKTTRARPVHIKK